MAIVLSRRFAELIDQYAAVAATAYTSGGINGGTLRLVDGAKLLGWLTKVKSLLRQACGDDSAHLDNFSRVEKDSSWWTGSADKAALYFEILKAAQEDYDGGYLESIRTMVSAEVFASELEQAEELLRNHYHVAAAVIAGTVLETTVRALADRHGVAKASLNRMNDDLVKAGAYNTLEHKGVTALAAVRNAAAHGQTGEFTPAQVQSMLRDVLRFVTEHA